MAQAALKETLHQVLQRHGHEITVVKANGTKEVFDPDKLRASLLNSGASSELTEKAVAHVLAELHGDMTTNEIYSHAYSVLKNLNRNLAHSYSLRRAVMDLGPSGFPFEDFIAEILKAQGYQTKTREMVLGGCVPHEIDVVAWNKKKLIMCEAKFHNELGTKSDLKVVLYVKARIDDLKDNVYNYGGENRQLDEGWLITNTKFSSTAIHYGACKNLVMIGWNYPEKGNLHQLIEEEGLFPVTCLTTLTAGDKKTLLAAGVVLCSHIKENPNLLTTILGRSYNARPVLEEINELYK